MQSEEMLKMDDSGYFIIVPIGFVIAVVFGIILAFIGGATGLQMWFEKNLFSFIRVTVIISIISAIICSILTKNIVYGFSCIVAVSQAIFFVAYGGYTLPHAKGMYLEYVGSTFWSMIVFFLYIIFSVLVVLVTFAVIYIVAAFVASEKWGNKSKTKEPLGSFYYFGGANCIAGLVGWAFNGIVFGILPLIF